MFPRKDNTKGGRVKYLYVVCVLMVCFVCGCDNMMGNNAAKKDDVPIAVYGSL